MFSPSVCHKCSKILTNSIFIQFDGEACYCLVAILNLYFARLDTSNCQHVSPTVYLARCTSPEKL